MIKSIKKLFSVDESELDFDEVEDVENKANLYQKELAQHNIDTTANLNLSINNRLEEQGNKFKEIEANISYEQTPTNNEKIDIIKDYQVQTNSLISDDLESSQEKTARRSFDFEKAIENSYDVVEDIIDTPDILVKDEGSSKKDTNDIINKDNYVLKDIISPMRGVIRKETNTIKKEEEHKKAQIIKLREQVKTKEIDIEDGYAQTIEFPFDTGDTKELETKLADITNNESRDTLSETSRFTLIEDSTGEMRLVIDEEE